MDNFIEERIGTEVVDGFVSPDGSVGLYFSDGYAMFIEDGAEVVVAFGIGMEEFWAKNKISES